MSFQNEFIPHITNRELQVVLLAFAGKASKDIASELKIQKSAVDLYRRNLLTRFNVNCLTQLLFEYPGIPDLEPGKNRYYPKRRTKKL